MRNEHGRQHMHECPAVDIWITSSTYDSPTILRLPG
jgi:hypothetical protein